jgi:hypothetical protein
MAPKPQVGNKLDRFATLGNSRACTCIEQTNPMELLMTLEEVATYLRPSKDTIYRLANAAKFLPPSLEVSGGFERKT